MKRIAAFTLGMFLCLPAILPAHRHCHGHGCKGCETCEKCADCGKCNGCANCKQDQAGKKSSQPPADTQKK